MKRADLSNNLFRWLRPSTGIIAALFAVMVYGAFVFAPQGVSADPAVAAAGNVTASAEAYFVEPGCGGGDGQNGSAGRIASTFDGSGSTFYPKGPGDSRGQWACTGDLAARANAVENDSDDPEVQFADSGTASAPTSTSGDSTANATAGGETSCRWCSAGASTVAQNDGSSGASASGSSNAYADFCDGRCFASAATAVVAGGGSSASGSSNAQIFSCGYFDCLAMSQVAVAADDNSNAEGSGTATVEQDSCEGLFGDIRQTGTATFEPGPCTAFSSLVVAADDGGDAYGYSEAQVYDCVESCTAESIVTSEADGPSSNADASGVARIQTCLGSSTAQALPGNVGAAFNQEIPEGAGGNCYATAETYAEAGPYSRAIANNDTATTFLCAFCTASSGVGSVAAFGAVSYASGDATSGLCVGCASFSLSGSAAFFGAASASISDAGSVLCAGCLSGSIVGSAAMFGSVSYGSGSAFTGFCVACIATDFSASLALFGSLSTAIGDAEASFCALCGAENTSTAAAIDNSLAISVGNAEAEDCLGCYADTDTSALALLGSAAKAVGYSETDDCIGCAATTDVDSFAIAGGEAIGVGFSETDDCIGCVATTEISTAAAFGNSAIGIGSSEAEDCIDCGAYLGLNVSTGNSNGVGFSASGDENTGSWVLVVNNGGTSVAFGESKVDDSFTDVGGEGNSSGGACGGDVVSACNGGTGAYTEVSP